MSDHPDTNPHFNPLPRPPQGTTPNPHFNPQPTHGTTFRTQPPPPRRPRKQRSRPEKTPTPHFPINNPPHYPEGLPHFPIDNPQHYPEPLPRFPISSPPHYPQPLPNFPINSPPHYPQPLPHLPVNNPPNYPQPLPTATTLPPFTRTEREYTVEFYPGPTPQAQTHEHPDHHPQHHPSPPTAIGTHPIPTRTGRNQSSKYQRHDNSPHPTPSSLRVPSPHTTRAHTWLIGAICALFWIGIILAGLIILIVYIVFRPRSPKFDISNASLNAAYLDMGYLLNADMTILANFTNPSKKAAVDFSHIELYLYYEKTLIATTYVNPFSALKGNSRFRDIHLVSSQVWLPPRQREKLRRQINNNRVRFEVTALLHTRSDLGSIFRYTYRLYAHCIIEVTGPPSGVLVAKRCKTKR